MVKASGRTDVEYYGFDLFRKCAANNFVSTPMHEIERKLRMLGVKKISLFAGDSRETLPSVVPTLSKMDIIYIDGCHLPPWPKDDWGNVQPLIHSDTVVIFDDYCEPGVKRVVDEIESPPYQVEILRGLPKAVVRVVGEKVTKEVET